MKLKKLIISSVLFFLLVPTAFAEMQLFVGEGCEHCENLQEHLNKNNLHAAFEITEYEIYNNQENKEFYLEKSQEVGYTAGGVPLLIDGSKFIEGFTPIKEYLSNYGNEEIEAPIETSLSVDESNELNEFLKEELTESNNEIKLEEALSQPSFIKPAVVNPDEDNEKTVSIIGIIVIIFGLTIFTTILFKSRTRR